MTDYNLTVDSTPQDIPVQVTITDKADWILTPTTRTYVSGTSITLNASKTCYLTDKVYSFDHWTITGGSDSTDIKQTLTLSATKTYTAIFLETGYYPVRDPSRRSWKYDKKNDGEVAQIRTIALKPLMVDRMQSTATEQDVLEMQVSKIIHKTGIVGMMIHHYRNFSQELYSLKKRFTSESLNTEAQITANKWLSRGLDPDLLIEIASQMGITITSP